MKHGGGVFRHLLHVIPEQGARSIDFEGVVTLWTASCGAVCVVLGDPDTAGRSPCEKCFRAQPVDSPEEEEDTMAKPSEEEDDE